MNVQHQTGEQQSINLPGESLPTALLLLVVALFNKANFGYR